MNKSVKTIGRLDHQYTPENNLHQFDAHMIYTTGEQTLHPVAYNQWHKQKVACIQGFLSGNALSWFLRFHESYKYHWSAFVSDFKNKC